MEILPEPTSNKLRGSFVAADAAKVGLDDRPIRRIHQGRYGVSVPALTKDHKGNLFNTPYPEDQYAILEIWNAYNILEDIKRGPYSKKLQYSEVLIRASRLEEVMADNGKKSSMETFAPNDKADYYFRITSITVNGKNAYELKGKFLDDLHNNAFSGTNGKDAVEHIEYYLKIIDPIKLPNVDHDKIRVVVFPISLVGGARRWFDGIEESITCWVDLTANFFGKYYPPSRIEGNNTPKMGGDEIEVFDDESSDLEEYWSDKEETAKIFKIETNIFDYETPLCLAFNQFNYLIKAMIIGKDGRAMRFTTIIMIKENVKAQHKDGLDTAYSLNEYSVFDIGINTAYPGNLLNEKILTPLNPGYTHDMLHKWEVALLVYYLLVKVRSIHTLYNSTIPTSLAYSRWDGGEVKCVLNPSLQVVYVWYLRLLDIDIDKD
ncbi:hypothetical protein Tco_1530714 [Tanacetum coccineum]